MPVLIRTDPQPYLRHLYSHFPIRNQSIQPQSPHFSPVKEDYSSSGLRGLPPKHATHQHSSQSISSLFSPTQFPASVLPAMSELTGLRSIPLLSHLHFR